MSLSLLCLLFGTAFVGKSLTLGVSLKKKKFFTLRLLTGLFWGNAERGQLKRSESSVGFISLKRKEKK